MFFFFFGGPCKRLLQPFVPLLKPFHYSFCQRFFISACLNKLFDLICAIKAMFSYAMCKLFTDLIG